MHSRCPHGAGLRERVYGPKLMLLLCAEAARQGLPIFLYGAAVNALPYYLPRAVELLHGSGVLPTTTAQR